MKEIDIKGKKYYCLLSLHSMYCEMYLNTVFINLKGWKKTQ